MKCLFRIRRKGKGERSKIYPPLIVVQYGELNSNEIKENVDVHMEFSISYELDGANLGNGMEVCMNIIDEILPIKTIDKFKCCILDSCRIYIGIRSSLCNNANVVIF